MLYRDDARVNQMAIMNSFTLLNMENKDFHRCAHIFFGRQLLCLSNQQVVGSLGELVRNYCPVV